MQISEKQIEAAVTAMAQQDITFANCDASWQKRTIRAALEAALSAAEPSVADEPIGEVVPYRGPMCQFTNNRELKLRVPVGNLKVGTKLFAHPPALTAQVQDVATHRHKKRGTEYVLMGAGKMQAENWRELVGEQYLIEGEEVGTAVDMREVAIYRSVDDGSLWVRPVEEFNDGRFETLPAAPAKQESKP